MIKWLLFLLGLPLLLWGVETAEGPFSAEVIVSAKELWVQDRAVVTLNVSYPEGYNVNADQLRMNLLRNPSPSSSSFTLDAERVDVQPTHTQIQYTLSPQKLGPHKLSFYEINFKGKEGNVTRLTSPIFSIVVKNPQVSEGYQGDPASLLTFSNQLPVEIDDHNRESLFNSEENLNNEKILNEKTLPIFEGIAFALFGVAIFLIKNYQAPLSERDIQKRILTAQQKALAALESASAKSTIPNEYFVLLSNTVRHFIEDRTQIRAPNYTTEEFLSKMQYSQQFSESARNSLSTFLDRSDKVKFAKYTPSAKERDEALQSARDFILSKV